MNYINREYLTVDEDSVVRRVEYAHEGNYRIECILSQHSREYYNEAYDLKVLLKFSGEVVGCLSGHFIPTRPNHRFFRITEDVGVDSDLWKLVKIFCNSNGVASRINHPLLESSPSKQEGGFFHISKVEVQQDHRGKDLGLHMIHHSFVFLKNKYSLAVIAPGLINSPVWGQPRAHESRSETEVENALNNLSRHYARMGFQQASKWHHDAWFLPSDHYFRSNDPIQQWVPRSRADQIPVFRPTKPPELEGLDLELSAAFRREHYDNGANGMLYCEMVDLIRSGASINASSAMYHAVKFKDISILQILIDLGGNVNDQNERGQTALHHAAKLESIDLIKYLVRVGANKRIVDEYGFMPIDVMKTSIQYREDDFFGVRSLGPQRGAQALARYEAFLLLMPEHERNDLVDRWMSPRMKYVLEKVARDLIDDCTKGQWSPDYFPPPALAQSRNRVHVLGGDIGGWKSVLVIIVLVLKSGLAPTVRNVREKCREYGGNAYTIDDVFTSLGGKIEYVLDELFDTAENAIKGRSELAFDMDGDMNGLPTNSLDRSIELARIMCIDRGSGKLDSRGPYGRQRCISFYA